MLQAEEVAAMMRLHELGWGQAAVEGVRLRAQYSLRYLRAGGAIALRKPERKTAFDGLEDWLRERFFRLD